MGFSPERGNRYGYYFGTSAAASGENRTAVTIAIPSPGTAKSNVSADFYKFGGVLYPVYGGAAMGTFTTIGGIDPPNTSPGGLGGVCPGCEISAVAAANIDNDTAGVDSWFIASKDGTGPGSNCNTATAAPAGVPYNTYNDVDCP